MPELPEVETVRRGLQPALEGARLSGLRLHRANLRYPFPDNFAAYLEGATVTRLERRAKYLLFHLQSPTEGPLVWVTHLGMTGRFQVTDPDGTGFALDGNYYHATRSDAKHLHVQVLAHKDGVTRLIDYYDPRRFGFMWLLPRDALEHERWYQSLGIEPLSNHFNADWLHTAFGGRSTGLKALLMDQSLISGLGNIYVCEALWRAGLSPDARGDSLNATRAADLSRAIREVLEDAVAAGGSSISDFASASGELGYFQHRFKVYDRENDPCLREGCAGHVVRKTHSGRSTFYCAVCQTA
ncbi:MAG: bifunctional DNA-formamidopyrimidine glycosylase/DNA-(apurinic or apyrimidinic site) lyase [Asticcacaulis sp.]